MSSVFDGRRRRANTGRAFEHEREDAGRHGTRELFLKTIHRLEPGVSRDLMGAPLALYRPLIEESIAGLTDMDLELLWVVFEYRPPWSRFRHASERDQEEVRQLRDLLLRWSRKWRLRDEWCLEAAVDTLAFLSLTEENPEPVPLWYWGRRMIKVPFREEDLRFVFSHPGWIPTLETWSSAAKRMDRAYEEAKQQYREHVEAMCRDAKLRKVSSPRHRFDDHIEWLVRFQVCRESWTEIAATTSKKNIDKPVTDDAVAKAVSEKAKLIGLTLAKPVKTGRPLRSSA